MVLALLAVVAAALVRATSPVVAHDRT